MFLDSHLNRSVEREFVLRTKFIAKQPPVMTSVLMILASGTDTFSDFNDFHCCPQNQITDCRLSQYANGE